MIRLFKANFRKEYIELKRYLPNTVSLFVTVYCIFLAIFLGLKFVGDPATFDDNVQYSIISMIFWTISVVAMSYAGGTISQEAMRGTLEQLYMSPSAMWKIMLSRLCAQLSLQSIVVLILLFAAMLTTGQWLNLNPLTTIPVIVLTLISMIGVGFMIAGIALIYKQIDQILQILQFVLMGLTFIPLSVAPFLVYAPFVKGVDMIRTIMMRNYTLADIPVSDFVILVANAIIYLVIGLYVYLYCEKKAMKSGLLGQY